MLKFKKELKFYISCPEISKNDGGLYLYNGSLNKLMDGNIRGLTFFEKKLCYVKSDSVYELEKGKLFEDIPLKLWHDIKYDEYKKCLYLVSSETKYLYQVSHLGKIENYLKFDDCYWPNCCLPTNNGELIVFLSAKRPYAKSKIIFLNQDLVAKWEYNCFEKDEIHSPFLFKDELYWCRSNKNSVVKASLSEKLNDAKKILINNDGYTRGLCIFSNVLIVGTSENRHSENCLCRADTKHGCIHIYSTNNENYKLEKKIPLNCKEVYDILLC